MDGVFHTNCYYFWPNRVRAATELLRVMRAGAQMVTVLRLDLLADAVQRGMLSDEQIDPLTYMMTLERVGFVHVQMQYYKTDDTQQAISYEAIFARKRTAYEQLQYEKQLTAGLTDDQVLN